MSFNLFGDLAADLGRADRAVHTWWPDAPGTVSEVRFAHSPGRFDPSYLNSLRAFDVAFVLDLGGRGPGGAGCRHQISRVGQTGGPEAKHVVVHPAGNSDFAETCDQYRALLTDTSTFASATLEEVLDADVLPGPTTAALCRRYLPS